MKTQYLWFFLISIFMLGSCDLEEVPVATASDIQIFGTEKGLNMYVNGFYNMLPENSIFTADYMAVDVNARKDRPAFFTPGAYGPSIQTGWDWGSLRNINFFLENNNNADVPEDVRNNYNGLARFWRAWFYFDKVKEFGDVPWIDRPLDVKDDQILYGPRDPRELVMDNVLDDLNYAIANIYEADNSRTKITRDVALAFKSRVCLFEGTWRKYHTELQLTHTVDAWLTEAVNAAKTLMDKGNFSIFTDAGTDMSYRELFINQSPVASEIIFGRAYATEYGQVHVAGWHYNSPTTGVKLSPTRHFINTYLMLDGTPFTNIDGYATMVFPDEVKGRDKRLQQSIRMGDYKKISGGTEIPAPPDFSYTLTGYHTIKWTVDDVYYDEAWRGISFLPIIRYAEVLLNYAEAKAELNTLTDSDWSETIGTLRARAGITGGIDALPTVVDSYLQSTWFPEISDPVLLEVRRERSIELHLEVSRFDDIRRWRQGDLFENEWDGIWVPSVDQYFDLNEDGDYDVYFHLDNLPADDERISGVKYVNVADVPGNYYRLTNETYGQVKYLDSQPRVWDEKMYLMPIPQSDLILNPTLGQNPGWD